MFQTGLFCVKFDLDLSCESLNKRAMASVEEATDAKRYLLSSISAWVPFKIYPLKFETSFNEPKLLMLSRSLSQTF